MTESIDHGTPRGGFLIKKQNTTLGLPFYAVFFLLLSKSLNSSINSGLLRLISKKHSFKIALLGITEFIERGFIPKPELLLK